MYRYVYSITLAACIAFQPSYASFTDDIAYYARRPGVLWETYPGPTVAAIACVFLACYGSYCMSQDVSMVQDVITYDETTHEVTVPQSGQSIDAHTAHTSGSDHAHDDRNETSCHTKRQSAPTHRDINDVDNAFDARMAEADLCHNQFE